MAIGGVLRAAETVPRKSQPVRTGLYMACQGRLYLFALALEPKIRGVSMLRFYNTRLPAAVSIRRRHRGKR